MKFDPNKPVHVYKNIRQKKFSIRQNGRVVAHLDKVLLKDCEFKVQPAGRQKVLDTKTKNVHAYVKGFIVSSTPKLVTQVYYNPYKYSCFVSDEYRPVYKSNYCKLEIGPQEILIGD